MSTLLTKLKIDRVDLVDEGADSAAFFEIYKRKELTTMTEETKTEEVNETETNVNKSADEVDTETKEEKVDKEAAFSGEEQVSETVDKAMYDELMAKFHALESEATELRNAAVVRTEKAAFDEAEVLKSLSPEVQEYVAKMRIQKEAAEELLRKAKEAEAESAAIAKAKELSAIPADESTLVDVIKSADPKIVDLLTTINNAIEATVLTEVGKNKGESGEAIATGDDAWDKIVSFAKNIQEERKISKEKAIAVTIEENPDLYANYIKQGGKS